MQTLHLRTFEKNSPVAIIPASGTASIFLHDHDFTEIIYVERGCGLHVLGSESKRIQQGDILIVPVGCFHCIRPVETEDNFEDNFKIINIIFNSEMINLDILPYVGTIFDTKTVPSIKTLIMMLLSEYEQREMGWASVLQDGLRMLISIFSRLHAHTSYDQNEHATRENYYVNQAILYYQTHYTQRFSVDDIARHVGLSKGYLQRIFKADTGQTLMNGIASMRVQKACELLLTTDMSVYEIASQVGFADCNQMHIVFKRFVGMTPKTYRTQNSVRIEREREVL